MRNKGIVSAFAIALTAGLILSGCGNSGAGASSAAGSTAQASSAAASSAPASSASSVASSAASTAAKINLSDGTYEAKFTTDSTMFHVNEAYKNVGTLTVKDGKATLHVTLASKSIVNLFVGTAEDAQKDGAELLKPTTDTVKFDDGTTDEAYGFDIPVPVIDAEFDCALIGSKGKWYDHKVKVSDVKEKSASEDVSSGALTSASGLKDGEYKIDVTCDGGTGKGGVDSAVLIVKGGQLSAKLTMSSDKYTKAVCEVDLQTYKSTIEGGKSVFTVPVMLDTGFKFTATTEAMSTPHDIEYTLTLNSGSLPKEAFK